MEKSEEPEFDSFQQEIEAAEKENVTYRIIPFMLFGPICVFRSIKCARMKIPFSHICRTDGVDGGEVDVKGLKRQVSELSVCSFKESQRKMS
ncbi:hypothetical protein AVEN_130439-1 [Araneus ventricosus]|uniref:Uncharacterized protein n=1 Tax=Araneus ventricosus TaxID=182803 RepID=A0A4Y2TPZ7_ARAVE|nr:hypothetical protein AVEN_130439-1 [Araneus ventricosus]